MHQLYYEACDYFRPVLLISIYTMRASLFENFLQPTAIGFLLLHAACTSHKLEAQQAEEETPVAVVPDPPPVVQPPAIEKAPEPPPPLEETSIVPLPATTKWRELPGMESIVDFRPFVFGVLAICGPEELADICKLKDDDTLEMTPVEFPEQDHLTEEYPVDSPVMTGNWRSDAWIVGREARNIVVSEDPEDRGSVDFDTMLVLRKLRTDEWYPSPIGDKKRVPEKGQLIRKGWAGGMLVWDADHFIRVPADSEPPAPTRGATKEGRLDDFFEAQSGRLYTVVDAVDTTFVQGPCSSPECVIANAVVLPPGVWNFGIDIPRGENSISVIVRHHLPTEERTVDYLLHFDTAIAGGRWSLDRWPTSDRQPVPTMLWPDTRGGMWVEATDALWYRDERGQWFDVALPFEVQPDDTIHFANRMKPREFLVLLVRGGVGRVFATKDEVSPT